MSGRYQCSSPASESLSLMDDLYAMTAGKAVAHGGRDAHIDRVVAAAMGRWTRGGAVWNVPIVPQTWCGCAGPVQEEHSLARRAAERLWRMLHDEDYVPALDALTGNRAVQMMQAGLEAIYLSG